MKNYILLATAKLQDTKLVTGGLALLEDLIGVLMLFTGGLTVFFVMKNLIMLQQADEEEKPKYKKAWLRPLIIGVVSVVVESIIYVVFGYFQEPAA